MRSMQTSALALLVGLAATPALAQEVAEAETSTRRVDTVIVTTQKVEQRVVDVPINVAALSGGFLERLGAENLDQISRLVAGFGVQEQSTNNPGFVIRGITSDSGEATTEPRVAVFQDGVPVSRSRGSYIEPIDIARIEVAKGPQATLFGRGALIGAVNLIQNKAIFGTEGKATIGGGNFGEIFADGAYNFMIGGEAREQQVGVRIAARYKKRDGTIENEAAGEDDLNGRELFAWRIALAAEPTENIRFDLIANYQRNDDTGTSFKSRALRTATTNFDPWDTANLSSGGGLEGRNLGTDREIYDATLLGQYELSDAWTLNSVLSWRRFDSTEIFDPDGFSLPMLVFAENAEGDQAYAELRLRYDQGGLFSGFAGVSYFTEDGFQRVPLQFDERVFQALLGGFLTRPVPQPLSALPTINLNPNPLLFGRTLKSNHTEEFTNFGSNKAFDVFADVTLRLTPTFELTGGIRYTDDEKTTQNLIIAKNGPSQLTGTTIIVGSAALAPGGSRVSRSETFDRVTYRGVARWTPMENVSIYASIARGARPEVIAVSSANVFSILPSEEVDSIELGAKAILFDNTLTLDGSVYDYTYENFQTTIINAQGVAQSINAGNASSQGFEMQAIWNPVTWFQGYLTYGYNKSRFDDTDGSGRPQQFAGRRFRLSPDNKVAVSATFYRDTSFGVFSVTPIYTWQSETRFEVNNLPGLEQPSYGLFDLRATFEPANSRYRFEVFGRNLADEDYIIDAGNTGGAFGIPTFIAGPPLTYGIRASASF